jgi:hypothetical protein
MMMIVIKTKMTEAMAMDWCEAAPENGVSHRDIERH